ncbi:polynucleotidyl transferase, ribonuclease H-like superfamily protein [Tasmannia lanceolata]|uniref:polynucleotidyl transferase, ribonuclease H-like superfamily protein n=1 Tax=Tasmannia lanceolata TaxID=3420 RepID=UPI004063C992
MKVISNKLQAAQRRMLCSSSGGIETIRNQQSGEIRTQVKQVSKANFTIALDEIKNHIQDCDFIAVSSHKTGSFSDPWRRLLPFLDTSETAYLKAKNAAERFELLHFSVCPFKIQQGPNTNKLLAYPYNFLLFPRDELNIGMPSYSFSCQTSSLASMAREGFDFNICIYDGLSYLSRVQEASARYRIKNSIPCIRPARSSSSPSVADAIFMERIKSRVRNWRDGYKHSNKTSDDALVTSLRKLILGSEVYGSRPCLNIDVCNDHQVELVLVTLSLFSDDIVPLIIPDKGGGPKIVRIVLTNSEEDKNLLKSSLQNLEEEQSRQIRGFREVIDAMSTSHKPIVAYNCLSDFTFIHSKFLGPLPPSMSEFMCSLRLVFSSILDVNHLWREIGPLKKANNLSAAFAYLRRQFFVPLDVEIPHQVQGNVGSNHGHDVLRIANLFSKLVSILKIYPSTCQTVAGHHTTGIEDYANIFYPCCTSLQEPVDGDVGVGTDNVRKVSTENLVFLWGFRVGISAGVLKRQLQGSHDVLSGDFEVKLVDKTCAVLVFWDQGSAEALLTDMDTGAHGFGALLEMISNGLKAAGYEAYKRVLSSDIREAYLPDSFDKVLTEPLPHDFLTESGKDGPEIHWSNDSIELNDL